MGYMTLADFREDLQSALGDRGIASPKLDRWINFGYHDLAGSLEFHELTVVSTFNTVASTPNYAIPAQTRLVRLVFNETDDSLLTYVDPAEYYRLDRATTALLPLRWTRVANNILLHPTPTGIKAMAMVRRTEPVRLSAPADTTALPDTWDAAVHMLSVHHGFLTLNEEQRAIQWLTRAINYIQTRATEEELFVKEPGLGLATALPLEKRLPGLAGLQGGAT